MALLRTELEKAGRQSLKVTKATRGQSKKGFEEGDSRHSYPLTFRPEETRKLIEARVTPDNKRTGGEETPLTESGVRTWGTSRGHNRGPALGPGPQGCHRPSGRWAEEEQGTVCSQKAVTGVPRRQDTAA